MTAATTGTGTFSVVFMVWTAAAGVSASALNSDLSTSPSWSSRAWDVYQRHYRLVHLENKAIQQQPQEREQREVTTDKTDKDDHWKRLLGMIADDRYKRSDDILPDSRTGGMCESPFGTDDRDRIASCFGEQSVVMASYESDVRFATSILSTLNALGGDDLLLFDGNTSQTGVFEFIVHHHYDEATANVNGGVSTLDEDAVVINDSVHVSVPESSSVRTNDTDAAATPTSKNQNGTMSVPVSDISNISSSSNDTDEAALSASESPKSQNETDAAALNEDERNNDTDVAALITMLKCIGSSSDDVHDFVSLSFADPDVLQEDSLSGLCSVCMQEVHEMLMAENDTTASDSLANTYAGGSSNAYLQLYCTDSSESTLLLTAGGGHDGQAGPNDSFGSGGGAGIQIQVQPSKESEFAFDPFSACNGGGCGIGTHMAGENLDEDSIVLQDTYCSLDAFVAGLALVKEEVHKCISHPENQLTIRSGGESNGFVVGNSLDFSAQYEYTTSFRFST